MIINDFSTLGLSGKSKTSSSTWFHDSGASNHMSFSSGHLTSLKKYDGNLLTNTADGGNIPITSVGKVTYSLP